MTLASSLDTWSESNLHVHTIDQMTFNLITWSTVFYAF
jgi:hypothetical protein